MRNYENSTGSQAAIARFHGCSTGFSGKRRVRSFAAGVFLLALATGFSPSSLHATDEAAPLTKQQVKQLIKTAKTPEDHLKLAHYYRYEADKLKSDAKEHQEMAAEYIHHTVPKFPTMSQHCVDLSGYLTRAEKQAEQLASMHEEMAKGAEK